MNDPDKYSYLVEWYNPQSSLVHKFSLVYYRDDNSVELHELNPRRIFLKRTRVDNLSLASLYIGNVIRILGRQLTIVAFNDICTRAKLGHTACKAIVVVLPDYVPMLGHILTCISGYKCLVTKMRMVIWNTLQASRFYENRNCDAKFFKLMVNSLSSAASVVIEVMGADVTRSMCCLFESLNPCPVSSVMYNSGDTPEGAVCIPVKCYVSSEATLSRDQEFFFPPAAHCPQKFRNTALFTSCSTCCIIKPHAVMSGCAGPIIDAIKASGFEIKALGMFHLSQANAFEFYEVYRGVLQDYMGMVQELSTGPCIAMELVSQYKAGTADCFRDIVGPIDPDLARQIRPNSLRAKFGMDRIRNAVHCTDLVDDALTEVEYFFRMLDY